MLSPALLGGVAGALASTVLPWLLGPARQAVPRWFGFLRITYVRTAAATVFGITITTAISLSTDDHTHKQATYIGWYGVAALALIVAVVTTIVIDRRLARTPPPEPAVHEPRNASMNRLIRQQWQELREARSEREKRAQQFDTPAPSDADQSVSASDHEPSTATLPPRSTRPGDSQVEERLVTLYREGEQLQARIFWSGLSIVSDLIQGTASQRQIERERLARDWDGRVLDVLPEGSRAEWITTAFPAHKLDPASTIVGVRSFLATKLASLKEIISRLDAKEPPRLLPSRHSSPSRRSSSLERESP